MAKPYTYKTVYNAAAWALKSVSLRCDPFRSFK